METTFVTDGDNDGKSRKPGDMKSTTCKYWENGTCDWKEEYLWSQCPKNPYSKNYRKESNDKGELMLCTITEIEDGLRFNDDDLVINDLFTCSDNLNDTVNPYTTFNYNNDHYIFVEWCNNVRSAENLNNGIPKYWILLDS